MALINLFPSQSKESHIRAYEDFLQWKTVKKTKSFSENVLLVYFSELSEKIQPSSLWNIYSMLKSTISDKHKVNLENYRRLTAFIKKKTNGFRGKKFKVFTSQEVEKFLNEAPDEKYLATKVALIFGIFGACTSQELLNITMDDIETQENCLIIKLTNTKTKAERVFSVRGDFAQTVKKYQELRPELVTSNNFFLNYQSGRCIKQNLGKKKMMNMPKQIATYLKLPNPGLYTARTFRRTAETLLRESEENFTMKRHECRNFNRVAEAFMENLIEEKMNISDIIIMKGTSEHTSQPSTSRAQVPNVQPRENCNVNLQNIQTVHLPNNTVTISFTNCSNMTINFQ